MFRKVGAFQVGKWYCEVLKSEDGFDFAVCSKGAREVLIPHLVFSSCDSDLYVEKLKIPKYVAKKLASVCLSLHA